MREIHLHTAMALAFALAAAACSHPIPPTTTAAATPAPATATAATQDTEAPLASLTVDQLSGMLDQHQPVAIFDNNSPESYAHGHIPSARWLAFDHVTANDLGADHDARLVFYCHNEH